jgi:hypothetical protein
MTGPATLSRIEALLDASGVAPKIEALLPLGARPRQLSVRTLVVGILLTQADHRPAHLSGVHQSLCSLADTDQVRLGVVVGWRNGPHALTYRQVERTFGLVVAALGKDDPDGTPTETLQALCDSLLEASIVADRASTVLSSSSLAVDWTDVESFSDHRTKPSGTASDKEAAWGHRKGGGPGEKAELFFGYYLSLATMVADEGGVEVPELMRRMNLVSCDHDPVPPMVDVLVEMPKAKIPLGDVICDSGYAHRVPEHFALPLRAAGASLVMDLHPLDRGTQGTDGGAICCNGNLYCPMTPTALFDLGPLALRAQHRGGGGPRQALSRTRPLQARAGDGRRFRRLPPQNLPGCLGQAPLPTAGRIHGSWPRAPRSPLSPRAPTNLLHAGHHHRAPEREPKDHSAPRLRGCYLAPLLCETFCRRAFQLPDQGPRHG